MWIIRFILLGVLAVSICGDPYLFRHRRQYEKLLGNGIFNTTFVIVCHCLCFLIVALPPAGGWNLRPAWLEYQSVRIGFPVVGVLLICSGALLAFATLKQRKFVVGMQDTEEGLLTSGFYRYFRHPIYTGMLWIYLGLALIFRNPDGLLIFPALYALFFAETLIEEKNDMCVRFHGQYQAYRQTTRRFGPIWLWSALVLVLLALIALGSP